MSTLPAPLYLPPAGSLRPVCGRNIFIVNCEAPSQAAQLNRVVQSWGEVVFLVGKRAGSLPSFSPGRPASRAAH